MIIVKDDIIAVAASINVSLTESELDWVLLCYEDAQRQDPSGTWHLVVEDLIQQAVEFRKPGTFDQLGYEQTQPEPGDDDYFDDSEERRDFGNDDVIPDDVNLNFLG